MGQKGSDSSLIHFLGCVAFSHGLCEPLEGVFADDFGFEEATVATLSERGSDFDLVIRPVPEEAFGFRGDRHSLRLRTADSLFR